MARRYRFVPLTKATVADHAESISRYTGISWPVAVVLIATLIVVAVLASLKLEALTAITAIVGIILQGILPPVHFQGLVVPADTESLNELSNPVSSPTNGDESGTTGH